MLTTKKLVIEGLSKYGSLNAACKYAGTWPMTIAPWREQDPEFAAALDAARSGSIGTLEASMYRRAFKNDITGMFMLKALVPDTYVEKNQAIQINVNTQLVAGDWQEAVKAINQESDHA